VKIKEFKASNMDKGSESKLPDPFCLEGTLSRMAYRLFKGGMTYERKQSLDKEAMKIRKVNVYIHEIEGVKIVGHGRAARYVLNM